MFTNSTPEGVIESLESMTFSMTFLYHVRCFERPTSPRLSVTSSQDVKVPVPFMWRRRSSSRRMTNTAGVCEEPSADETSYRYHQSKPSASYSSGKTRFLGTSRFLLNATKYASLLSYKRQTSISPLTHDTTSAPIDENETGM